ncbi:MAG TPA: hypothetical protein VE709_08965 [Pseudonocardiaceae bacterium]|nr:hypothetical protein [Pseudonocardiaceae bacterium]
MHDVQIEVVLLSVPRGRLAWRVARGNLADGVRPDARARQLAGLGAGSAGVVVHSTSWRPASGGLVLSYAVLPDPDPAGARPVPTGVQIVCSGDVSAPSPPVVDVEHVLAHALRHLSLVARTSPDVVAATAAHPLLWDAVLAHAPGVAGELVTQR